MKPIVLALFVALAAGLVLAGCGQKGPLYLPGHNPNPPKPLIKPAKGQDKSHKTSADAATQSGDNGAAPSTATDSDSSQP